MSGERRGEVRTELDCGLVDLGQVLGVTRLAGVLERVGRCAARLIQQRGELDWAEAVVVGWVIGHEDLVLGGPAVLVTKAGVPVRVARSCGQVCRAHVCLVLGRPVGSALVDGGHVDWWQAEGGRGRGALGLCPALLVLGAGARAGQCCRWVRVGRARGRVVDRVAAGPCCGRRQAGCWCWCCRGRRGRCGRGRGVAGGSRTGRYLVLVRVVVGSFDECRC